MIVYAVVVPCSDLTVVLLIIADVVADSVEDTSENKVRDLYSILD